MNFSSWLHALEDGSHVLSRDGDRVFYRAWRTNEDGTRSAVVALLPVAEHPAPACLDRLEHEYGLKADLDSEWAVRPLEFIRDGQRALLVLEDFDGTPLDRLLGAPLETGQFLRLAIGIASIPSFVRVARSLSKTRVKSSTRVDLS